MKRRLLCAGLLIPTLLLAADRLNVKTGLWEVATSTVTSGAPPIPADALASMTPAQRAQMAAMFKSQTSGAQAQTSKECVTEKDLAQPFRGFDAKNCTATVVKTTAKSQDLSVVCTGETPSTGKMHFDAPTPQTVSGKIELTMQGGEDAMTIKTDLKGRWLSAACPQGETD